MGMAYIERKAEKTLRYLSRGFPIVAITGPRQSGKTTLARRVFSEKPYVSLEDLDNREFAAADPKGFLGHYEDGAVFDEAQRAPSLFSWLQGRVDGDSRMGRFVVTGSQQFGVMAGISQSLAGRVGELKLLPFCMPELRDAGKLKDDADTVLYEGFYPAIHVRDTDPVRWYNGYIGTYLERDVRSMITVQDLRAFQAFLRLSAGRCGQLLNLSSLGSAAGVSHNTAKAWLSVLEAGFITFTLLPFHKNFNKRLIKSPKLYFYDTGLVSRLLGITSAEQLELHPLRGAIFENFVVSEAVKSYANRALPAPCFFWRDSAGQEIDLIFENGSESFPVEIKSGKTVAGDFFDGLRKWKSLSGADGGALVFGGGEAYEREGFQVVPWNLSYELAERQCFAAP